VTAARNEKTGSPKCTGKRVWVRLEKNPTAQSMNYGHRCILAHMSTSVVGRAHRHAKSFVARAPQRAGRVSATFAACAMFARCAVSFPRFVTSCATIK